MLSVLGQRGRPCLVNRFERLKVVESSPARLASAEVERPYRTASLSIPAHIWSCDNMRAVSDGSWLGDMAPRCRRDPPPRP